MLIDVRPDHLDIVRRILRQYVPQAHVWAFGSRAKWNARDISDLDLCIDNGARLSFERMGLLEEAFANSTLPYKVDVVDMHSVSDSFRQIIEQDKVALPVEDKQAGGVPEGWGVIKLADFSQKIGSGATPRGGKEVYLLQGDTAFIRSQNIYNNFFSKDGIVYLTKEQSDELKNVEVFPEDILLNITGDSVARVCRVPDSILPARVNQHVAIIRTKSEKINSRFLGYFLVAPEMQNHMLSLSASGATRKALTKGMIENFSIICPPLPEQKAIAAILGALDDKIEANRRMNATLEGIARALFKSWFVDFDPVRANAEGRPSGLPADLDALFPASFTDSPLGEIPAGWEEVSFLDMIEIVGGGTPKTSVEDYWNGEIPWFSVVDAPSSSDIFVLRTEKTITKKGLEESSARMLPVGTTIISARGTVGKLALVGCPMTMNQSCYGLTPQKGIGNYFLYFSTVALVDQLKNHAHGSVFDTITRNTFAGVRWIKPHQKILVAFEQTVAGSMERIKANVAENQTLATLRDTLLPKLISGQIRVKDAEKRVENAI